jgi:PAS domain S-box-containing protein
LFWPALINGLDQGFCKSLLSKLFQFVFHHCEEAWMNEKLTKALSESGGVWEDILDSLPGTVSVIDKTGHTLYMNSYGEKFYRVEKDQYVGRHCLENADQIMPPRVKALIANLIDTGEPHKTTSKLELKDGLLFTSVSVGVPLSNNEGYLLVGIPSKEISADKQELKRLTGELEKYGNFLENLIDSSPNAIFATTENGTIELSNKKSEAMFVYGDGGLLGMNVSGLLKDSSEIAGFDTLHNTQGSIETFCVTSDGKHFPVRLQISDIKDARGGIQGKLYLFTDITREKAMEAKLALTEKLAIYSELMADIFHQINNPLVGVVNFASVLLERMDPKDNNRNLVSTIFDAGRKCQKLITTMMRCIREPESTFGRVEIQEVLGAAIQEAMKEESERAEQVTLKTYFDGGLPFVRGDALQLHEVFRNLLVNALQAMSNGGTLKVNAVYNVVDNDLEIQIADTGEGISQENLDKVFTPFFSTKKYTGGGLGLSFAYQVIKAHTGRIEMESELGKGTLFRVFLPVSDQGEQK